MKKLLAIAAALIAGGFAMPNTAEARDFGHSTSIYVSGRSSCGCAIQTQRVFTGYDHYRRPVFRYVQVPIVHQCRSYGHGHQSHHRPQYGHSGYSHAYQRGYGQHSNYSYSQRRYYSPNAGYGQSRVRVRYGR